MYQTTSEQSGRRSLLAVWLELVNRGYMVMEADRDADMDLVAWVGRDESGHPKFTSIQVKTMSSNQISKVVDRKGEVVSRAGKTRNSIDYAKRGIDWLVGVNSESECFFYKHETYSKIPTKSFSVKKYSPDEFPMRAVESNNAVRIKFKNSKSWTTQN